LLCAPLLPSYTVLLTVMKHFKPWLGFIVTLELCYTDLLWNNPCGQRSETFLVCRRRAIRII